jgi:hypothetical protein
MPVAIVESEKTAMIASVYLPQFIWLAAGSLTNLNADKCSVLKGRTVTLFPDLQGYDKWNSKANELSHLAKFTVSDLLERKATEAEKKLGFDLADYLIEFDLEAFALPETEGTEITTPFNLTAEVKHIEQAYYLLKPEQQKQQNWEKEIFELNRYFAKTILPTQPLKINKCITVLNVSLFVESHFVAINNNKGNRIFLPYLNRLQELKRILTTN